MNAAMDVTGYHCGICHMSPAAGTAAPLPGQKPAGMPAAGISPAAAAPAGSDPPLLLPSRPLDDSPLSRRLLEGPGTPCPGCSTGKPPPRAPAAAAAAAAAGAAAPAAGAGTPAAPAAAPGDLCPLDDRPDLLAGRPAAAPAAAPGAAPARPAAAPGAPAATGAALSAAAAPPAAAAPIAAGAAAASGTAPAAAAGAAGVEVGGGLNTDIRQVGQFCCRSNQDLRNSSISQTKSGLSFRVVHWAMLTKAHRIVMKGPTKTSLQVECGRLLCMDAACYCCAVTWE